MDSFNLWDAAHMIVKIANLVLVLEKKTYSIQWIQFKKKKNIFQYESQWKISLSKKFLKYLFSEKYLPRIMFLITTEIYILNQSYHYLSKLTFDF
jgi:hypothetical protein